MYSLFIDDQASGFTSRIEGRKHLDEQLLAPFIIEEPSVIPGAITSAELKRRKDAELRENWGRDPEAQAQWQ